MLAEGPDGVGVIGVRVGIRHADDDRPKAPVIMTAGREHGGDQRISLVVPQCQEQRHFALNMRFEPDLLLDENFGHRLKCLDGLLLLFAKELLDGMAHTVGFTGGLGFGLDPEPGVATRGLTNISHASSHI